MRKTSLFVLFIATLLIVTPVLAREHETTGDRINVLFGTDIDFPANTPFHIRHGWYSIPEIHPGQWLMELEVDGEDMKPTFKTYDTYVEDGEVVFLRIWYWNFPDGMTGQHTFTVHSIIPCWYALQEGWTDYCANPNADFDVGNEIVVTFIE